MPPTICLSIKYAKVEKEHNWQIQFLCPSSYGEVDIWRHHQHDTFLSAQYLVYQWLDSFKFSWIYNWDITKNWIDFGELDLIFKVTAVEKLKIHGWGTSVFSENTISSFFRKLIRWSTPHPPISSPSFKVLAQIFFAISDSQDFIIGLQCMSQKKEHKSRTKGRRKKKKEKKTSLLVFHPYSVYKISRSYLWLFLTIC